MIVKVEIKDSAHAVITTHDGKFTHTMSAGMASKRLVDKKVGFFKAEIVNDSFELGDRVPDEAW